MATQVQFRRGTTAQTAVFAGALGEVTVDTTKKTCVVHDGSTLGGFPLLLQDGTNSALAPGSLASLSLKFANSSNTGVYSPSTSALALVTNGVSRLAIDSSGNVTIPGSLTVSGSLSATVAFGDGTAANPSIRFTNYPTTGLYAAGANQLGFSTNGVSRLVIDASGNIVLAGGAVLVTTNDVGTVTSTMILNGTIVDTDINVAAAIAGTKVSPNFGSQNVVTTGTSTASSFSPSGSAPPTNGVYLPSANNLGFATSGSNRLTISSAGQLRVTSSGSAADPIFTFDSDPDTGIYSPGANQLAFTTNGVVRLTIDASGNLVLPGGSAFVTTGDTGTVTSTMLASNIDIPGTLDVTGNATFDSLALHPLGSVSAPSITFTGDPNTGIYSPGADQLAITAGGVQKLSVQASGVSGLITSGTEVATTTGSAVDFTGIPSWVKRITIIFDQVSSSSNSANLLVQLGSTTIQSTSYGSTSVLLENSVFPTLTASTSGFIVSLNLASSGFSGHMIITNISGNRWISSSVGRLTNASSSSGGGHVTLTGVLDRLRITLSGAFNFDAGAVNIFYEG